MKKTIPLHVILLLALTSSLFSQNNLQNNVFMKLQNPKTLKDIDNINSSQSILGAASILFPLNPIFVFEDKKFYFGLTKEFSIGKIPYGRIAAEYSVIFRETHLNHLRFSYNYDFLVETGDIAAILISVGGGYFTDFDKQGYFPQASFSIMIPAVENVGIMAYIKFRNTIMTKKEQPDIFDVSLGLATAFYFL